MFLSIMTAMVLSLGAHVAAHPTMTSHVPLDVVRGSARLVGLPSSRGTLELTLSLPQRNAAGLQSFLDAIENPASPEYRHFLSVGQYTVAFGPSIAEYASLVRFALANDLHPRELSANRRVLDVEASVGAVERAFHVRIGMYRRLRETRTFYAPDREPTVDLAVPLLHISGLDDAVVPVSHLVRGTGRSINAAGPTGSGPDGSYLGSDIRAAYYGDTTLTGSGQSVGLFEFGGYNAADVRAYFSSIHQSDKVPLVGKSLNGQSLNCSGSCDDGEQVIDIEEAISMAPGLKQVVVYVGANDVSIINKMASDDTSKQLSCSYGFGVDPDALAPIFKEMAAQGQNFLVATGDDGYHLADGGVWPADDQLVTAVGGTDITTSGAGGRWQSEVGWSGSGGGPSPNGIPIPAYQKRFITAQNGGSTKLRNVPDVAGVADTSFYSCYDGGCSAGNGGTSFAAPLWASYLALANEQAAAKHKPAIGFLNPIVYRIGASTAYAKTFHDQISGYNGKYNANRGFDLVTGFGSPVGHTLINALVAGN